MGFETCNKLKLFSINCRTGKIIFQILFFTCSISEKDVNHIFSRKKALTFLEAEYISLSIWDKTILSNIPEQHPLTSEELLFNPISTGGEGGRKGGVFSTLSFAFWL